MKKSIFDKYPIDSVVRDRTIIEELVGAGDDGTWPFGIAPEVAQAIGRVVLEAAGSVQQIVAALLLDRLDRIGTLRPVAQFVCCAALHWRRRLLVFYFRLPRMVFLF